MRVRRVFAVGASVGAFMASAVVTASPASAAGCTVNYMRMSLFSNGYVNGAYIFGPLGRAQSLGCVSVAFDIVAQPAVVGGVPRVATPGGCTSPSPSDPVLSPNESECSALLGYGGIAADATSYPYVTLTGVAVGVGADGSRSTVTHSCTLPVPYPDAASSEYCKIGTLR